MDAVIVLSRCASSGKLFAIRIEKRGDCVWVFDWAFAVRELAAEREGYDTTTVEGTICQGDRYPGCPHCGSKGVFLCSCGKLNCWDGVRRRVTCAWCQQIGELSGEIRSLRGTGDV